MTPLFRLVQLLSKLKEKFFSPPPSCQLCGRRLQGKDDVVLQVQRGGRDLIICAPCFHALLHTPDKDMGITG